MWNEDMSKTKHNFIVEKLRVHLRDEDKGIRIRVYTHTTVGIDVTIMDNLRKRKTITCTSMKL